jgi:hypothetical protein
VASIAAQLGGYATFIDIRIVRAESLNKHIKVEQLSVPALWRTTISHQAMTISLQVRERWCF